MCAVALWWMRLYCKQYGADGTASLLLFVQKEETWVELSWVDLNINRMMRFFRAVCYSTMFGLVYDPSTLVVVAVEARDDCWELLWVELRTMRWAMIVGVLFQSECRNVKWAMIVCVVPVGMSECCVFSEMSDDCCVVCCFPFGISECCVFSFF